MRPIELYSTFLHMHVIVVTDFVIEGKIMLLGIQWLSITIVLSSSVVRAPYRNHGAAGSSPAGELMVVFSQLLPV